MKPVTKEESNTIKMLSKRGLTRAEICTVTRRSPSTIDRALSGKYEKMKCNNEKDSLRALLEENLNILAKIEEKLEEDKN